MAVINFLIIAFVVFLPVRYVNGIKAASKKQGAVAEVVPAGPAEQSLLIETWDALKRS